MQVDVGDEFFLPALQGMTNQLAIFKSEVNILAVAKNGRNILRSAIVKRVIGEIQSIETKQAF